MSEHENQPQQDQQQDQQHAWIIGDPGNIRRDYYDVKQPMSDKCDQSCWSFGGWADNPEQS
jgi:hypothetical protein